MKKIIPVFCAVFLICGSTACLLSILGLNSRLNNSLQISRQMKTELDRISREKEKLSGENEDLRADTVLYMKRNTELEAENERLEKENSQAALAIETKDAELKRQKELLIRLGKKNAALQSRGREKTDKEKAELSKKIETLESELRREKALYHYNLGVAYSQAEMFDEAVVEYGKSLEFDPDNPEAHYNLGVLYADLKNDPDAAIGHYQKYLQLNPKAKDREEVQAAIESLR